MADSLSPAKAAVPRQRGPAVTRRFVRQRTGESLQPGRQGHGAVGPGGEASPRVLYVTPSFFGYERDIADAFTAAGAEVTVVDERASNVSWVKALARVAPSLLGVLSRGHFTRALASAAQAPPDLVVVVRAEVVPRSFLRALRRLNPDCVFVFYGWDAFTNCPRGIELLDEFDHTFSFDRGDAAAHAMTYKPLFHTADYSRARELAGGVRERDLVFVGTVHTGRWAVWQRLFAAGRNRLGFFYAPARWYHALRWLTRADVRQIPWSDVSFSKMSREDVAAAFASARGVVDVPQVGQSGLTMRTFEVLASGAGLVTTNPSIVDEACYDPRWVHVLAGPAEQWDIEAVSRFLEQTEGAPAERMAEHSLAAWVQEFLDLLPGSSPVQAAGRGTGRGLGHGLEQGAGQAR